VVGVVTSVSTGRQGVPSRRAPELLLDHIFVKTDIENLLLGNVKEQHLQFTYFTYSIHNKGGIPDQRRSGSSQGNGVYFFSQPTPTSTGLSPTFEANTL
jgi:hypothetical protein